VRLFSTVSAERDCERVTVVYFLAGDGDAW
jgi:hypothetical protein